MKPIRLVITRGEGCFTLKNIDPLNTTVFELKTMVCQQFNELYPEGVKEEEIDWSSPK